MSVDLTNIENEPIANGLFDSRERRVRPGQFSVRRILGWMTTIAILLTLWRFREMYQTITIWVGLGVFGALGVIVLGVAFAELRFMDHLRHVGKRTRGKLCRYQKRRKGRAAVVRFRVGDKVYEIVSEFGKRRHRLPPIGTETGVMYPPEAPEKGRIIPPGKRAPEDKTGCLIVFGVLWLVATAVAFWGVVVEGSVK